MIESGRAKKQETKLENIGKKNKPKVSQIVEDKYIIEQKKCNKRYE